MATSSLTNGTKGKIKQQLRLHGFVPADQPEWRHFFKDDVGFATRDGKLVMFYKVDSAWVVRYDPNMPELPLKEWGALHGIINLEGKTV